MSSSSAIRRIEDVTDLPQERLRSEWFLEEGDTCVSVGRPEFSHPCGTGRQRKHPTVRPLALEHETSLFGRHGFPLEPAFDAAPPSGAQGWWRLSRCGTGRISSGRSRMPTVLFVDDEVAILELVRRSLSKESSRSRDGGFSGKGSRHLGEHARRYRCFRRADAGHAGLREALQMKLMIERDTDLRRAHHAEKLGG
jgi:hypothetical protein